jgi:hypothetical protein
MASFMSVIKGHDNNYSIKSVQLSDQMTCKTLVSSDWAMAWEENKANEIIRMCLFHHKGIVNHYIYFQI